jgi:hypothetical protein
MLGRASVGVTEAILSTPSGHPRHPSRSRSRGGKHGSRNARSRVFRAAVELALPHEIRIPRRSISRGEE